MTKRCGLNRSAQSGPVALSLIIFICDLTVPLGYTVWLFYVLPVWLAGHQQNPRRVVFVAGFSSLLIAVGFAAGVGIGAHGLDAAVLRRSLFNRGLALVCLWLMTGLIVNAVRKSAAVIAIQHEYTAKLHERTKELERFNALLSQENERRQVAEGELLDAQTNLEAKVLERTHDLHETNARLRQSMEDHRVAEDSLRRNEERLRLAMEAARMGTWDWDIPADRIVCSENLCGWLGLSSCNAASYDDFLHAVHPDERDHVDAAVSSALEKVSPYSVDFRVIDRDGTTHWIHSRGNVIHDMDGRAVRMIGVATDITARKQADEALWEALELETVILRSVPVVTYVTDATDQLVTRWISDNVQTVSGYPPQRFLSEHGFWIDRIHPDDRGRVLEGMQDLHRRKSCKSEYRWLHHDGSYHWFFDHISVKHDAQGAPQAFIGVWLDVTERKQAEESLHRVLEERERLSQELHDGVIQTLYALGLTVEESQRLIKEDAGKAVSLLDKTVATINLTISSLRRYICGREPEMMRPALLKSELNSLVSLIEAFDARVTLQLSDDAIDQLTPGQLEHVFFIVKEALSNAARHSNGTEILVSIAGRSSGVRVAILDNGSGFNVEAVRLGQGLRNMQSRGQKMGAHFSLISAPKRGTLVVVKIPKEARHGRVAR